MTAIELFELKYPTDPRKTTVRVLLAVLLIWSFGLRLWYATPELNSSRFWDERYGLENLEPLLKEGQLRPVHGFHPGFSYLPHGLILKASDLIYQSTGWQACAIFDERGRYTSTTYLICRTISVVFGTATLWLLFLIGRRLGGDRLGLLAAFLLSVVPWHLRQSVLFKADIALLFAVVLTFYLSLRAIEKPSARSFAATGVAIGLALSAKFNAGPVAMPLTLGAFLSQGSKRRALLLLVLAAAVSIGVFLALQPFVLIDPDIYRRSMGSTSRFYERVARRQGHGRLYLFQHLLESLVSRSFHGGFVGVLAIAGFAVLTILAIRYFKNSPIALPWLMVVCYVVSYTVLYAIATPRPSPHNWLPVSPFAALAAAWALLASWLWLAEKLPDGVASPLAATAVVVLVAALGWQGSAYVYRETVPRTSDRTLEILRNRLRRPPGRLVFSEHDFQIRFETRHRVGRLAIHSLEDLQAVPVDRLNWSDAEVFPVAALEDPTRGDFYRSRIERLRQSHVIRVEPRWFRSWGPSLVVLMHPLRQADTWWGELVRSDSDPRLYVADLPAGMRKRHRISIHFQLPRTAPGHQLRADRRLVDSLRFRGPRFATPFTTHRLRPAKTISLQMKRRHKAARIPIAVRIWRTGARPNQN